jgi:hypothetical protein
MQPNLAANDAERQRKIASLAVGGLACLLAIYHLKLLPLLLMVGLGCIVGYALASPDVLSASSRRYSTDNLNRV